MAAHSTKESPPAVQSNEGIKIICACTIQCSAEKLYAFWRQLENLPLVMHHLISVTQTSPTESHWVAKAPVKKSVEWDAEIINETPNKLIAWRTKEGSHPAHAGSVRFEPAPGGQGTEVTVSLEYDPPGGKMGSLAAKLFGEDPGGQIADDLRRLKALIETGVIPTIHGQSAGGRQMKQPA